MENQKFTIGAVQQNRLLDLGLDIKDAYILTYLKDIIGGSNKIISKIVDDEVYYWIKYENIIKYLPILKIDNLKVISRRLARYDELGLIKRHIHRPFNQMQGTFKGAYTFICLTEDFASLFETAKLQHDDAELERAAKEMGLSLESSKNEDSNHENLKVPVVNHHGNSKVPSIEGTQKFSHNTPNNNTPNNKKATANIDTVNKKEPVPSDQQDSSSSLYEFLNNYKLDAGTKENIKKHIKGLTEERFKLVYIEIAKRFKEGRCKDFSAMLFTALKDNWEIKTDSTHEIDTEKDKRKLKGTSEYYFDLYINCGGIPEVIALQFENEVQNIRDKNLIAKYKKELLRKMREEV